MKDENILIILNDMIEDANDHNSFGELLIQLIALRGAIERGIDDCEYIYEGECINCKKM
jgi:hypothetical protein